ncbi:hypothetical protein [Nocardia gipuzkoensis]
MTAGTFSGGTFGMAGGSAMTDQLEPMTNSEPEEYLAAAAEIILDLPPQHEFVNADIHRAMRANGWPELREPRRFGPMLLRLRNAGFIVKVDERSTRARSHGGMTSVWRRTAQPSRS